MIFSFLILRFITMALLFSFCPCPAHGSISLIETQTECGPISLCSTECWGGLQIKKPSPGCAHQSVQHCSPGRFTTYILFYGPFLIHHNTASILLTSPPKHTSFPLPSVFFSLLSSIQLHSPSSPWRSWAHVNKCMLLFAQMNMDLTTGRLHL